MPTGYVRQVNLKDSLSGAEMVAYWRLLMEEISASDAASQWGAAVTQKSPCEGKRVIMGEESALKLSQRGLDARQGGAHENPEAIIRPRTYDLST